MASITVSGLSDEFVERLKKRAAINERSTEDEVRHVLEQAVGIGQEEKAVRLRESAEKLKGLREQQKQRQTERGDGIQGKPSLQIIREDRDSDHGRLYDPWGLDDSGA